MPYGLSDAEYMAWVVQNPGKSDRVLQEEQWAKMAREGGPAGAQAAQAQQQEQDRRDAELRQELARKEADAQYNGRFAVIARDLADDPENAQREAESRARKEHDAQLKAESDAMAYFRDKSAAVQNRSIDGYGTQVSKDRMAFNQGMNTDNAQSLGLLRGAAEGNAPSLAAVQQRQGINASIRAGMSGAANAGPSQFSRMSGGIGGAQQGGQFAQQAVQQAGALRGQEMAQARGAYGQATDARASQYQALRNQEIDMAMKQREQNDKASQAWYGLNQQASEAHKATAFEDRRLAEARRQNANVASFNAMTQGLGAASGVADAGFKWAGALNSSPDKVSKPTQDGVVYDDYGRPVQVPSDVRIKSDVQMSKPHLLAQWRVR